MALCHLVLVSLVGGCDSPARVKPWRHAPDPIAEAAKAPGSPALADVSADAQVRAARGHTLRIHVDAEPGRLNPLVSPTTWGRRITLGTVFEPLLRYVPPDANQPAGRFAPRLARSWSVVAPPWGGLEIRIELEPGATFHDGHPLTSSDVQFTLDAIRDPRKGIDHLRTMLDDVEAVELITPTQVRLVLKGPSGYVLRALAEIPILPMHIYNDNLLAGGALVGSGPYKLVSNKNGTVHLTRYDHYWGTKPAIPDIEFVYEPDAALALKDAKRGDYDILTALIPAHWPEQATAPGISAAFAPLQLRPPRMRYLAFNATKPPLDDARVRHAIALLVNRNEIVDHHFDRLAKPVMWPIWPGGFVHGPELAVPAFDPKAAGALLDQAGWIDSDKDGIRDRNGVQLKIVMLGTERATPKQTTGPELPREYLIEAARRIGVVIELKTGGEQWVASRVADGNYQLVERQWSGMVDMDASARIGPKDPLRAPSPRVDRALEQMATVWDPAERAKLATELAAGLAESWPIAGIVADFPQGLVHRRVKGVRVWDGWIDLTQLSLDAKL
ncbi:MAG TPA: ABC transporter substrate-binding protein [Kofleriaceae bacterium]|nr:ABC transporter substrate-binding protein [Kofleriaceae bacterium]